MDEEIVLEPEEVILLQPTIRPQQPKSKYYTPAQKRATMKYRDKHREEFNEYQRKLYERKKQDPEWLKTHNAASIKYNEKYRDVRKLKRIEKDMAEAKKKGIDYVPKKRGRPRKSLGV